MCGVGFIMLVCKRVGGRDGLACLTVVHPQVVSAYVGTQQQCMLCCHVKAGHEVNSGRSRVHLLDAAVRTASLETCIVVAG